jgi:hypothetical protein
VSAAQAASEGVRRCPGRAPIEVWLPKLDVEGSNPFARFDLSRQGPDAANAPSGPSYWFEFGGSFRAQNWRLHHDCTRNCTTWDPKDLAGKRNQSSEPDASKARRGVGPTRAGYPLLSFGALLALRTLPDPRVQLSRIRTTTDGAVKCLKCFG